MTRLWWEWLLEFGLKWEAKYVTGFILHKGPSPQRTPNRLSAGGKATHWRKLYGVYTRARVEDGVIRSEGMVCARGSVCDARKCTKVSYLRKGLCAGICYQRTKCQKMASPTTYGFSSFSFNPTFTFSLFLPLKELKIAAGGGWGEVCKRVHINCTLLPTAGWLIPHLGCRQWYCCEKIRSHELEEHLKFRITLQRTFNIWKWGLFINAEK